MAMVRIQKLNRPNKRSGFRLEPGKTTKIRGMTITNVSAGKNIWVDKFQSPAPTKKKKKTKKK